MVVYISLEMPILRVEIKLDHLLNQLYSTIHNFKFPIEAKTTVKMIAATYISPVILALASFNVVTGAAIDATKTSEVVPGPGLPSLKELGITSAELYKIGRPDSCMSETLSLSMAC